MSQCWRDQIRRYRRVHGLTQAALGEQLNVEQATVSRWERGTHVPELGMQRRLRDLMRDPSSRSDLAFFHRIQCALSAVKVANRSAVNMAASAQAAQLHGVRLTDLAQCNYRQYFTDLLESQWGTACQSGFFAGDVASVKVVNYWRPACGTQVRHCVSYWTPTRLNDGEYVLVSEFREIEKDDFDSFAPESRISVISMDEILL